MGAFVSYCKTEQLNCLLDIYIPFSTEAGKSRNYVCGSTHPTIAVLLQDRTQEALTGCTKGTKCLFPLDSHTSLFIINNILGQPRLD